MEVLGLFEVSNWLLILVSLLLAYYTYTSWHFSVFSSQGIPGPKPYPFLGNIATTFRKGFMIAEKENVQKYGKCVGVFEGRTPVLLVSDEEMLKEILVKEFPNFANRRPFGANDDITRNFLTVLQDDDWKRIRNTITPTFTSGKLKGMSKSINNCAKMMVQNARELVEKGEDVEMKEIAGAFTMDVIARVGFGLQIDSQKDKNNQFVVLGKKAFNFGLFNPVFLISFLLPFLTKVLTMLNIGIFPYDVMSFFRGVIQQVMNSRNDSNKKQQDLLQLMMNAGNKRETEQDIKDIKKEVEEHGAQFDHTTVKSGMSTDEILAQGLLFFLAGYDTTATTLSLVSYNLTVNPDCQQKLYDEICRVVGDADVISYDMINELYYLDMCIEETLRVFPPAIRFDRMTKNDITIKGIHIPKDMVIGVPVIAIHHDPQLWPEPDKYDPERFSSENKAGRSPFAWMPFGYGPRNCIGMRLALMEAKMAVAEMVRNFKLEKCTRTQIPMTFKKGGLLQPESGIWIKASKRV